jgi:hypothetical protein
MNLFIKCTFILTIAFCSTFAYALVDLTCFKYEPAVNTVIGILKSKVYPGEPNFVSIEAGDEPETIYFVELKPPICTITKEESWMLGHERISEVQLAVSKLQFGQLDANLGKVVTIKGSLFEAFDEHHHTPVLMDVSSMVGSERNDSVAIGKIEKPIKPSQKQTESAKVSQQQKQSKPTKLPIENKKNSTKKQANKSKTKTESQKSKNTKSNKKKKRAETL